MNGFDEEQIGRLLRLLPPAPEGWVRAAGLPLPPADAAGNRPVEVDPVREPGVFHFGNREGTRREAATA